jgi:phage shock protein E
MSKTTILILIATSAAIMGLAYYLRVNAAVSSEKAHQLFQGSRVVIDVRTFEEFQSGHLKEATNVPLSEIESRIATVVSDKNTPVLLYCRSGARSASAMETLLRLGYVNAVNLGSYDQARKMAEDSERSMTQ